MLEEIVWFLIFGAVISLLTVFIKIIIEFPGLLKFKCIYREQSAEDDFQEVVEVNVDHVMAYYQLHTHKSVEALKKKQKARVREISSESESEILSISDIMHDAVTSSDDGKLTDKESAKKEIAIEIEGKPVGRQQDTAPHQLTIKVHRINEPKKVTELSSPVHGTVSAVIEHHRETTVPAIEISAHNKHGHVRQH